MQIEYFFDCSSPWTYLSFSRICKLLARYQFDLKLRPVLVGGIFNTINPSVYEARDRPVRAKGNYYSKDLADWAEYEGISVGCRRSSRSTALKPCGVALQQSRQG